MEKDNTSNPFMDRAIDRRAIEEHSCHGLSDEQAFQ
jgi:hypothetical protein